jgi:hypothetical protein
MVDEPLQHEQPRVTMKNKKHFLLRLAACDDGARALARFNVQKHQAHTTHGPLAVWTLKRRERRAPLATLPRHAIARTRNPRRLPLTLTLSPGEREQPLDTFSKFVSHRAEASRGFAKTLGAFLPLPKGEGRSAARSFGAQCGGEGKQTSNFFCGGNVA